MPPTVEKAILAHALDHPTQGAQRVADELTLKEIQVSSGGVRGMWIRNDLQTRHHLLLRLEETVRKRKIKLSEEQIQALDRSRRGRQILGLRTSLVGRPDPGSLRGSTLRDRHPWPSSRESPVPPPGSGAGRSSRGSEFSSPEGHTSERAPACLCDVMCTLL